jgi:hypothetical protein
MHRNALHDPHIPTDIKTQVWCKLSRRAFCGIHTGPTRARKIVHIRFTPGTHSNALRDPQIPPNAKTQVWHNVSRHAFSGIHTGLTRARKMVPQCFVPQTHRNALRDRQIQPDAKHKFGITCLSVPFGESMPISHEHEK